MKNRILFDTLLEKIPNKYELVVLTGRRVRELGIENQVRGKETLVQKALREVNEGKLVLTRTDSEEI